jgi:uncharacterized protein
VVHSPPKGHVDGGDLGIEAVLWAIEAEQPQLAVCGDIHECWGQEATIGCTRVLMWARRERCSTFKARPAAE